MNAAVAGWLFFRCLRWGLWLGFFGYCIAFVAHRPNYVNSFGNLLHSTEFWMFGLPIAAVFAGFFELAARERCGLSSAGCGPNWSRKSFAA